MTDPAFSPESRSRAHRVHNRWPLVSGLIALAVAVVGGILIVLRDFNVVPYEIDQEWSEELLENDHPLFEPVALFFDWVGGGWVGILVVPLLIIGVLLLMRRPWAALYFAAASVASALVVQVIKNLVDRPRPEDILVHVDFGSFPSGHVANAATIAVVLGLITHRWWVWALGAAYTVAMMFSRTYVGAHWLTDTLGGLVVGAGVALVVWAPFARKLLHDADRRSQEKQRSA